MRDATIPEFPAPGAAQDRAGTVAGTVLQIVQLALLDWLDRDDAAGLRRVRAEVEALLRQEFDRP